MIFCNIIRTKCRNCFCALLLFKIQNIQLEAVHIRRPLWGGGGRRGRGRQKCDISGRKGFAGVVRVQKTQSYFFLLKQIGFAPWLKPCSAKHWYIIDKELIMSFVDNIIVILGSSFLLTDYLLFREGGSFEIGRSRSRGWKNFGRRWTGRWRVLKLDNSYIRHMCIIPYVQCYSLLQVVGDVSSVCFL